MTHFDKWLVIVLTTVNPLTGRGVAIPLGMGFGFPIVIVSIVSGLSNFVLAVFLILFIEQFGRIGSLCPWDFYRCACVSDTWR